MLKKQNSLKALVSAMRKMSMGLLIATAAFTSCSDNMSYFDTPSWLRGSIYEILQEDGQYSIFLQGADRAGFTPILNGKSILTVMAPTDAEMAKYLQENYGTTNIAQVPVEEVRKLIGFHILYYSFDKDKLVNFRPAEGDGATEEEQLVNAGLYYKFRSRSQDPLTKEEGRVITVNADGTADTTMQTVNVYHLERYVPVYSHLMFRTKGINAKTNYEYFYGDGSWKGGSDGFNVSNAGVDEYSVIAKNGYIYRIDKTLKPLETIYKELQSRPEFSRYLKMYDEYSNYVLDQTLTMDKQDETNGADIYQHYHNLGANLAPIALEWPVSDYKRVTELAYQSYSVFAFTNKAFEEFFHDYWGEGGYTSPDDPELTANVRDLLFNSYTSESVAFPEEISKGLIKNYNGSKEGTPIYINTDAVLPENRVMCANGVLYGCSELTPPAKYGSVTGPAYQYKKFSYYLNMLNTSGLANTLSLENARYIMLYPTNEQMAAREGYAFNEAGALISNEYPNGVSSAVKSAIVYAHVAAPIDGNTILPTSGKKVLQAFTSDSKIYWYLKDGKITNSLSHNRRLKFAANTSTDADIWTTFEPLKYRGDENGWTNGHAYEYKDLLFGGQYNTNLFTGAWMSLMWGQHMDETTEFYAWINLLNASGLVNNSGVMDEMTESCLMFVPTTTALENAIKAGKVPGVDGSAAVVGAADFIKSCTITDKAALCKYLKTYFVPLSTAVMSNYPFPGWGEDTRENDGLITMDAIARITETGDLFVQSTNLNIYDDGSRLSVAKVSMDGVEGPRVAVSNIYDSFPFTFSDGCVHFLDGVIE